MKKVYFQELKDYSKVTILEKINNDTKTFDKLLKHTIISNVGESYQFKFVGVIIIDKLVINCYPKYIPSNIDPNNDFKQVADEAKNNLNKRYYFDNTSSFW